MDLTDAAPARPRPGPGDITARRSADTREALSGLVTLAPRLARAGYPQCSDKTEYSARRTRRDSRPRGHWRPGSRRRRRVGVWGRGRLQGRHTCLAPRAEGRLPYSPPGHPAPRPREDSPIVSVTLRPS